MPKRGKGRAVLVLFVTMYPLVSYKGSPNPETDTTDNETLPTADVYLRVVRRY
jgi:hypothetical protein